MALKSHLQIISDRQLSENKGFKYNIGFDPDSFRRDSSPKNYYRLAQSLSRDLSTFNEDLEEKRILKDIDLSVPIDIDYIEMTFNGQFIISTYFSRYYDDLGLEAVAFYNFAKSGLFAIIDRDKFDAFMDNVRLFIESVSTGETEVINLPYVRYISTFKLLRATDILKVQIDKIGDIVYLVLVNLPLETTAKHQILQSLYGFLKAQKIHFEHDNITDRLEIYHASPEQIQKIVNNFDIIESVTSSAITTVRPGEFNVVQRSFGFNIDNIEDDLPIVGVIDTGVEINTALGPIVIKDDTFSLAGSPLTDNAGRRGTGHGTAVAGLVALGKENHRNNFGGIVRADAKVLSIKISDDGNGYISEVRLLEMLYDVKKKYPDIRIFTLTSCYNICLQNNEAFSEYTYALDKFSYDTNSLIFICTSNNDNCINENTEYNLAYFNNDHTNIATPADSLNNFIVGAAADNLSTRGFFGVASSKEFPALYTRRGHVDLRATYGKNKTNKNFFRPDVIESGGDMGFHSENILDWTDEPALTLISARRELGIMQEAGTSFSTPLMANLAAKIIKLYPTLRNDTIKALIINASSLKNMPFPSDVAKMQNRIAGHGYVNDFKSLYSTDNTATMILEDSIENRHIKIFPLNFPQYLSSESLGKTNGIVKVSATLCFNFLPIKNNQVAYNPVHMAFSIFKNHTADEIMSTDDTIASKLRTTLSWSQNGRYISKPLPYANTQKIFLSLNVGDLVNENNVFKLAVHSRLSEQIIGGLPDSYPRTFPFSIVLTFEENIKENTGRLYDEIYAVNNLEVLQDVEDMLDADLDI
ncbi:MAG: S8 family peptidase [Chryseobacterium sp.]|nr:MAG: S8 family peptidase [Chryseobacterium sp.]